MFWSLQRLELIYGKQNTQNLYITHMHKFKDMVQHIRAFALPFELYSLGIILQIFFSSATFLPQLVCLYSCPAFLIPYEDGVSVFKQTFTLEHF